MKQFDYIIAGTGAAGLTLAYVLMGCKGSKKTVLLIDKDTKAQNDRTWCFWEKEPGLFEHLVYKSWSKAKFSGTGYQEVFDISPYQYKMIRGIDFYDFMRKSLNDHNNLTWITDEIEAVQDDGIVITKNARFKGELVFNSIFDHKTLQKDMHATTLLQHFMGYVVKTRQPVFDQESFTYMDFKVDQEGDCRFGYVLPFDSCTALIEYTLFSEGLLETDAYKQRLEQYIKGLEIGAYDIVEKEFGVIPMTDFPFEMRQSEKVIRIGVNGGFAKPSTGYTFLRTQKILSKLVQNLAEHKDPLLDLPFQKPRFKKYDATLLNVLASGKYTGDQVFTPMFKKNGAKRFFKFLDEETNLAEELKIMSSTPLLDFGAAFIKSMTKQTMSK